MKIPSSFHAERSTVRPLRALQAAFTLMEMMLVLAIIALLIAIGAVTLGEVDENAKFTTADAQINTVKTAVQMYKTNNRGLPVRLEDLVNPPANARVKKAFIEESGIKDPWGTTFQYRSPGKNGKSYEIYSWGPDKKEGGGDDVIPD